MMDSKTLKALIDAGAVKQASIIADGATVHIKFTTRNGDNNPATTLKGAIKTWCTIDAAAKWLRGLGIGEAMLNVSRWSPNQRGML
jgi:hypothetical protein